MTTVFLNTKPSGSNFPDLVDQLKEEQHDLQLFLSPQHVASSLSPPTLFNTSQNQRATRPVEESNLLLHHDHKVSDRQARSATTPLFHQPEVDHNLKLSLRKRDEKWMRDQMHKTMNSNCVEADEPAKIMQQFQYNEIDPKISSSTIRVCSDCSTTTTPLWRSGPRGPKSLCNACGIRQRKARRAMEAAAAANANGGGAVVAAAGTDVPSSMKIKVVHNKEKKSRAGQHLGQHKKHCKTPDINTSDPHSQKTKLSFKGLALTLSKNSALQHVLPQDVEDAAILLMELSCGALVHT